jgi:hypothetical protein
MPEMLISRFTLATIYVLEVHKKDTNQIKKCDDPPAENGIGICSITNAS